MGSCLLFGVLTIAILLGEEEMEITHELLSIYIFYSSLVLLKTLLMAFWTAKRRIGAGLFANPEDAANGGKVEFGNEHVERIRRCHQNDLETVLPFVLLGGFYITTNPVFATAKLVFRIFTIARYIHTFVYVFAVPQPSRAFSWFANQAINVYMLYCTLTKYVGHM